MVIYREQPVRAFKNKETGEEVMAFELTEPTIVHLESGAKDFYPHDYEVIDKDMKVTMWDKLTFELAYEEVPMPEAVDVATLLQKEGEEVNSTKEEGE